jgi:oligoendopeptidase F
MTLENTIQLQNDINKACYEVYGYSYHGMDTDVLYDDYNKVYFVCLDFMKKNYFNPILSLYYTIHNITLLLILHPLDCQFLPS